MLEERIRKNRDLLDGAEPGEGHFDRFQSKLDSLHEVKTLDSSRFSGKFFRIAAVIAVLLALSITYYIIDPAARTNQLAANTLPQEIQQARMYYNKLADEKLVKINECAASSSEASYIQKVAVDQISQLDSNTVELEQQVENDKGNTRLINALIRNYKTKSDLLDNILNRLCHI
jgi:hypothetical protein